MDSTYANALSPGPEHPTLESTWIVLKSISKSFKALYKLLCNTSPLKRDSISESTGPGEHNMELLHSASGKQAGEQEGTEVGAPPRCQWVIQRA